MSLRIEAPNHAYVAGQTVSGCVVLSGGQEIEIQAIKIVFEGRCKTKSVGSQGQQSKPYRGHVNLFLQETVLFRGPYTMKAEGRWPFQFNFPLACNLHQRGDPLINSDPNYNVEPHQPLPPLFDYGDYGVVSSRLTSSPMVPNYPGSTGDGISDRKAAFVTYVLKAQLISNKTQLFSSGILEMKAPLRFSTMRNTLTPDPQFQIHKERVFCSSLHLLPGCESRKLTFKEKLSSMSSKNTPTTSFDVLFTIPRLAILGQPIPMYLSIQHDTERSTLPAKSTVYLRAFEANLVALTNIRILYDGLASSDLPRYDSMDDRFTIVKKAWNEPGLEIDGEMDMHRILGLRVHEALSRPPTFRTFNISRGYTLKIKADIECGKKQFHVKTTVMNFDLLPSLYHGPPIVLEAPPPNIMDAGIAKSATSDTPPTYNAAASSSDAPPSYG